MKYSELVLIRDKKEKKTGEMQKILGGNVKVCKDNNKKLLAMFVHSREKSN